MWRRRGAGCCHLRGEYSQLTRETRHSSCSQESHASRRVGKSKLLGSLSTGSGKLAYSGALKISLPTHTNEDNISRSNFVVLSKERYESSCFSLLYDVSRARKTGRFSKWAVPTSSLSSNGCGGQELRAPLSPLRDNGFLREENEITENEERNAPLGKQCP